MTLQARSCPTCRSIGLRRVVAGNSTTDVLCSNPWHDEPADSQGEPRRRGDATALAQRFHETYERLAPSFGYETREASAKPWADVPANNRALMTAVCAEIIDADVARLEAELTEARAVVEAAKAYVKAWHALDRYSDGDDLAELADAQHNSRAALVAAIDQLDLPAGEHIDHAYTSTACHHGEHERCGEKQRSRGDLGPPRCKFCPAMCSCPECQHGVDRG